MGKNLCPENDISFENSYTIRFEENIPAGTYTISAVVKSEDTDSSVCLMLFYLADGSTKEVYISRSVLDERVFKTAEFASNLTRVRIYASEGYNPSVGDAAGFSFLQIEAGSEMTDFEHYGYTPEPEPEPDIPEGNLPEAILYYMAWSGRSIVLPEPTCRHTMLIKKILDPSYELPFAVTERNCNSDRYLWDLINDTTTMLANNPRSDMEKYFHLMLGGMVKELPNPDASEANYWLNQCIGNYALSFEKTGNPITCIPIEDYPLGVSVSFTPRQAGTGDPSPENVRPISGRDSVKITVSNNSESHDYTLTLPETIYGGTVNVVTGEGSKDWSELITLTGEESWNEPTSVTAGYKNYRVIDFFPYSVDKIVSSHFLGEANTVYSTPPYNNKVTSYPDTSQLIVQVSESVAPDLDSWKSYLAAQAAAGTPVQVAYKLATPEPFQATGNQPILALPGVNTVYTDGDSVTVSGKAYPTANNSKE